MEVSTAKHIPALDGLRGFAALYVVFFHLFPRELLSGAGLSPLLGLVRMGWTGVDLFFVLSGFLITGILTRTRYSENYYMAFYGRRILRIFPLYYALCFFFLALIPAVGIFHSFNDFFAKDATGALYPYWFFLTNFPNQFHLKTHAFLCVSWSLATEEQFYLVWPTVVRFSKRLNLGVLCVGILFFSATVRTVLLYGFKVSAEDLYHWPFTRLDGLAIGALVSIVLAQASGKIIWIKRLSAVLPFFFISWVVLTAFCHQRWTSSELSFDPLMCSLGYFLTVLLFGSLLCRVLIQPNGLVGRVFSGHFLKKLGQYSFAIYLLQFFASWLVGGFFNHALTLTGLSSLSGNAGMSLFIFACKVGALFAFSVLSWKWIEGPCNSLKERFRYSSSSLEFSRSSLIG